MQKVVGNSRIMVKFFSMMEASLKFSMFKRQYPVFLCIVAKFQRERYASELEFTRQ
jgi:hypothetical protein